jgi:hypothetical protein
VEAGVRTEIWVPLLTFVLGYVGRSISEWFQDRRILSREREARDAAKRERIAERNENFQRDNLLNLQESLYRLMRGAGAAHHRDMMAYKRTGAWERQLLPPDLDEMLTESQARTAMIMVRAQDTGLRKLVEQLKKLEVEVTLARTPSDSDRAVQSMAELFIECNLRIGELLRGFGDEVKAEG